MQRLPRGAVLLWIFPVYVAVATTSTPSLAVSQLLAVRQIKTVRRIRKSRPLLANLSEAAANFNSQLCGNVNVTVPFFVGCPSETTTDSRGSTTTILTNSAGETASHGGAVPTQDSTGTLEDGPSVATTGPLATFTGNPLLTGTCTMPQVAAITLDAGNVLEYPWMGCSKEAPDCCPFDVSIGGRLSVCPHDYFATSNACCPT